MIFSPGSIVSLAFVSLFVLMPEVPFLQSDQRILISVMLSPGAFACTTAPNRRSPHAIALSSA